MTFIVIIAIIGFCYAGYLSYQKYDENKYNQGGYQNKITKLKIKSSMLDDFNDRIELEDSNLENKKIEIENKFESMSEAPVIFKFNGFPYKFEDESYTAFDFELADDQDLSVVKLSIAHFKGARLLEIREYYFSPASKFDQKAQKFKYSRLHRISTNQVLGKPTIIEKWEEIKLELNGKHLIAHNIDYDLKILKKIIDETRSPLKNCTITCTSYYSKLFIKWMYSLKLDEICKEHKIPYWGGASKFKSVSTGVLFMYLSTIATNKSFNIFMTGKKINLNVTKEGKKQLNNQ